MKRRVFILTGSAPPDVCGVGDGAVLLAAALNRAGQDAEVLCHRDWSFCGSIAAIQKVLALNDARLHILYPSMGYKGSLGPHVSSLASRSVVTIHEFSLSHPMRKLSLFGFTLRSPRLIIPSEYEINRLRAAMPWVANRLRFIPICSQIPPPREMKAAHLRQGIVHFGLLMPRKGLETFIAFSEILRQIGYKGPLRVVGMVVAGQEEYVKGLMEASLPHNVEWVLNRDAEEVGEILSEMAVGYLPFPDGASDRRGSLRAVCEAGIPCITTESEQTTSRIREAVRFAATPEEAANIALGLMASEAERETLAAKSVAFAAPYSWDASAVEHIRVYEEAWGA